MKNVLYSLGIASFLVCMIFTVATSVTNPFYGMSDAAVAQATTQTTTTGSSGSYTYSINPSRYDIYEGKSTYSKTIERKSITPSGSVNVGYRGIIGAEGGVTFNPEVTTETLTVDLGKQVNCIDGGDDECYKSPGMKTNIYY